MPRTVFIATPKRKRPILYDNTVPIEFITIKPRKFFGWTTMKIKGDKFNISDPEKTIIDSLDLPQYSGGITEISNALRHHLDYSKLIEYADRLGNRTVHKRLGYLATLLDLDLPEHITTELVQNISSGYSWLDPTSPKNFFHHDSQWNLKINIPPDTLRSNLS